MRIRLVTAEPITSTAFAPFGQVIGLDAAMIEAVGDERFELSIVTMRFAPIVVTAFNRHFRSTQAQVALDARPSVIVVAPPAVELDTEADLDHVRAFICDAAVGYNLGLGTWHAGAYPLAGDLRLVNLQGRGVETDTEVRDIGQRFGVTVRLAL